MTCSFISYLHDMADGVCLFYMTPQHTTLIVPRQYALHFLFVYLVPSPGARLTALRHQRPICSHLVHKPNTLDRDRIDIPTGCDSYERSWRCAIASTQKRGGESWERDLSSDVGIDSDSDSGPRKFPRSSYRTKAPQCVYFFN